MEAAQIKMVRLGPSLGERISWRRFVETRALTRYRRELEQGTAPEAWSEVELPAGLMLADVCDALGLSDEQRQKVLGDAGMVFLEDAQGEKISE